MQLFGKNFALLINAKSNYYLQNIALFEQTFSLLKDDESRKRYIELLGYRILGFTKVKLSLNNEKFWATRSQLDSVSRGLVGGLDIRIDYTMFREGACIL